jgi:hypothetical protein
MPVTPLKMPLISRQKSRVSLSCPTVLATKAQFASFLLPLPPSPRTGAPNPDAFLRHLAPPRPSALFFHTPMYSVSPAPSFYTPWHPLWLHTRTHLDTSRLRWMSYPPLFDASVCPTPGPFHHLLAFLGPTPCSFLMFQHIPQYLLRLPESFSVYGTSLSYPTLT